MAQNRLKWVDNVKGIAMISVVLCHVVDGLYGANIFPESSNWLFSIRNILNIFQMPLFCMVSGYLFSKAYIDQNGNIKKARLFNQVTNLLSIYVLWCLIMGVFKIALSGKVNYEVTPIDLLLIWYKPIGVYWYLYVLIGLYLIFANRSKIKVNDITVAICLTVISLVSSLFVVNEGNLYAFRRIGYYSIIFFVGMLLNKEECKKTIKYIMVPLFIAAIVLCIIFRDSPCEIYHIPIVNLITAMGFCLAIILLLQLLSNKFNMKILSLIGKNSLDVYLLHVFLAAGCRMIISKIYAFPVWAAIFLIFSVSLFIPIVIGWCLKKIGVYELLFKPAAFFKKLEYK